MNAKIKPSGHMIRTLKMIQNAGHTSAIIAGGAIRDPYHDVLTSDVDIFIQHPRFVPADKTKAIGCPVAPFNHSVWEDYWGAVMDLFSSSSVVGDSVSWYYSQYEKPNNPFADLDGNDLNNDILSVWNVWKGLALYQIIFTKPDPIEYVETKFDFGLCKAYTDGTRVHFTSDFITDSRNKTITLVGQNLTDRQIEYAKESHLPRILEKYPGYHPVLP